MGIATERTGKTYPYYADITSIQIVPTEGKSDEITALISRPVPADEKIDLGRPNQAAGRLRYLNFKNVTWTVVGCSIGVVTIIDGVGKFIANGPDLTGGCEIIAGLAMIGHQFTRALRRGVDLQEVSGPVNEMVNETVLASLNTQR